MLVSFWSTHNGQSATTTNMLSIGLCAAFQYKMKVLIASAQSGGVSIKERLLPEHKRAYHEQSFYNIMDLMRLARNGLLQSNSISNYAVPILKSSLLDVLTDICLEDETSGDLEVFKQVLEMAKDSYDLILLDVHSGFKKSYIEKLLATSDAVVINTSQSLDVIDEVNKVLKSERLIPQPIACVGRYEKNCKMTLRQIKKILSLKEVMSINHHVQIIDAINQGNMLEYFGRYFYRGKFDKSHPFFHSVLNSTSQLLQSLEMIK